MHFKINMKKLLLICLISLSLISSASGQTFYRWLNLPNHGAGSFEKDKLSESAKQNQKFELIYEHTPGRTMRRRIKKFFPELLKKEQIQEVDKEEIDINKATIILENLKREGQENFNNASATEEATTPAASETESLF
jgi:hypothetical protein